MQCVIFLLIFQRRFPRCHLMTYTQYGKSFAVGLAVLTRICTFTDKFCILAGREKQASIIMGYIIDHAFDNPYTSSKLELSPDESVEKLRRERSKNHLTFRHSNGRMGEVMVLSADSRNSQTSGQAVMGFGAPNVILDEAALVNDDIESKIFRMLGGTKDNFYFKIGNPFNRNHFYRDTEDKNFFRINIDYSVGIAEGRLTKEFIEEAKKKPNFDILYENKFPPADMIDDKGYMPLLTEADLHFVDDPRIGGLCRLGVDPSGEGSDLSAWVVRNSTRAKIVASEKVSTPKTVAQKTLLLMTDLEIDEDMVNVDSFGEGADVGKELALNGKEVDTTNVGDPANDDERFHNLRAEAFWRIREFCKKGGELVRDSRWNELLKIYYKFDTAGRIQIMSKDEMRKRGTPSPNFADALSLTFCKKEKGRKIQNRKTPKVINYMTGESKKDESKTVDMTKIFSNNQLDQLRKKF